MCCCRVRETGAWSLWSLNTPIETKEHCQTPAVSRTHSLNLSAGEPYGLFKPVLFVFLTQLCNAFKFSVVLKMHADLHFSIYKYLHLVNHVFYFLHHFKWNSFVWVGFSVLQRAVANLYEVFSSYFIFKCHLLMMQTYIHMPLMYIE